MAFFWQKPTASLQENPTYAVKRSELLAGLHAEGWDVHVHDARFRDLKVPYATSPQGDVRYWFKPQAIYASYEPAHGRHDLGNARSVYADMKQAKASDLAGVSADLIRSWSF